MAVKKIKNETIDKNYSLLIREAYEFTCQYPDCPDCGNIPGGADDCSHYYGRRYLGGRWHPDNTVALCRQRHTHLDMHHHEHADFVRNHIGDYRFEMLAERMHSNFPYSRVEKQEIHEHYKAERARIRELRKRGVTGIIEVEPYD